MGTRRSWTDQDLENAVKRSKSYRSVIKSLGLIPAGGNYVQVQTRIRQLNINTSHFTGLLWSKGTKYHNASRADLFSLLVVGSRVQSYKLKLRLYESGLKHPACELCGWAQVSVDGRVPLELDHINGDNTDNRIENLRILCPNCHSLQPTHRGRNKKTARARMS